MNNKILKITTIGLLAALAYVSFTFLQIKVPTPGGTTSFHLGNTFAVLGALLVGGIPGGIAASIGMGIGDILDPVYITVAPKTIILKFLIGVVTGLVAHRIFNIKSLSGKKLIIATIVSCSAGMLFNIVGEPIFSYFYTSIVLGAPEDAAAKLAAFNAITTTVNAVASVTIASILYIAIYPRLKKTGLLTKLLS